MKNFRVLIIGGGIGGLCLAQGLKKAGIRADVFERDSSASSRLQGFRIHIDPQGSAALHDCLPDHLWNLFTATCGDFSHGFTVLSDQLEEFVKFREAPAAQDPIARHRSVSRITLRQILLAELGDRVHFDLRFERYEQIEDGGIRAIFEDGFTAEGDLLVAADGVNSRVRMQYLPGNDPVSTGAIGLGGRIPLTDGVMALMPPSLLDGPASLLSSGPASIFMAAWRRGGDARHVARLIRDLTHTGEEAPAEEGDYLVMSLGAPRAWFGLTKEESAMSAAEKQQLLRSKLQGWHPNIRKLGEMIGDELGFLDIRTSRPVAAWEPTKVTLLGDAIHNMTPYRGIGANIALLDAQLLCSKLTGAVRGEQPLLEAVGEYEDAMRRYGYRAVADSLQAMHQAMTPRSLGFRLSMCALRLAQRFPQFRNRMAARFEARPERASSLS